MGLSRQPLKDWRIRETEQVKPARTTASQNTFRGFLDREVESTLITRSGPRSC